MTTSYGSDIFTEAEKSADTLGNLGPLAALAGIWEGEPGANVHPVLGGANPDERVYVERYELQPIDAQTNGPQLFYGLRYHVHINKPDEVGTFHDQVGYWLWEPARNTILHTLAIPRGQVLLASGHAEADATEFEVTATAGDINHGIASNPFLNEAFRTTSFTMKVTIDPDGTWTYFEETVMVLPDRPDPFSHTDGNTLRKVAEPTLNPMAQAALDASPDGPAVQPDTATGQGAAPTFDGEVVDPATTPATSGGALAPTPTGSRDSAGPTDGSLGIGSLQGTPRTATPILRELE